MVEKVKLSKSPGRGHRVQKKAPQANGKGGKRVQVINKMLADGEIMNLSLDSIEEVASQLSGSSKPKSD